MVTGATDRSAEYVGILMQMIVPGVIFLVFNLCCGKCCCCGRCCCNKFCAGKCTTCCFTPSSTKVYGKISKFGPAFIYAILAFIIFVFGIIGITAGSGAFANSFIRGGCMIDTVAVRTNGFIDSILVPITKLNTEFSTVVDAVTISLGTTKGIEDSMTTLEDKWKQLKDTAASDLYKANPDCVSLLVISRGADEAKTATATAARKLEQDLKKIADDIQDNLLSVSGEIEQSTQESQKSADDMKAIVQDSLSETSKQAVEYSKLLNEHHQKISAAPFTWVFLVPCFFVLGMLMMKINTNVEKYALGQDPTNPKLMGNVNKVGAIGGCGARTVACAWYTTFMFAAISCLLAALFMPVAQVLTDVCYAVEDYPLKMGNAAGATPSASSSSTTPSASGNEPDILNGCWKGESIFDILGLADSMTFVDINFGGVDAEVNIVGKEYNDVKKLIADIPETCSGIDAVQKKWAFLSSNGVLTSGITEYRQCEKSNNYNCQDLVGVDGARIAVEESIKDYQNNLQNIQNEQISIISGLVEDIKDSGSCVFLKTTWEETYDILCTDATAAIGILGTMSLLVGVFGFISAFFILWANQTNAGNGPTKANDDTQITPTTTKQQELPTINNAEMVI